MKLIGIITLILSCMIGNTSAQDTSMLVGPGNRSDIWAAPYNQWSVPNYDHYQPEAEVLAKLKSKDVSGLSIVIVMGTWCSDSRREVPHFLKVLDLLSFPQDKVQFIFVDRQKDDGNDKAKQLKIKKVPTFIVYSADKPKEFGRIVETPRKTLEKDLLHILHKGQVAQGKK